MTAAVSLGPPPFCATALESLREPGQVGAHFQPDNFTQIKIGQDYGISLSRPHISAAEFSPGGGESAPTSYLFSSCPPAASLVVMSIYAALDLLGNTVLPSTPRSREEKLRC